MTNNTETPFRYQRRVEFADTDMGGILHFSSYFRYMEEAEHAFWRSLDSSVVIRDGDSVVSWPRVSASCDFQSPARFEETLDIDVSVEKLSAKTVAFKFDMAISNRPVATGRFVVVCCQISEDHKIKAIAIPDDLREKLET